MHAGLVGRREHELVVAVHDEAGRRAQRGIGERLDDDLGTDPERVAKRDSDKRPVHGQEAYPLRNRAAAA